MMETCENSIENTQKIISETISKNIPNSEYTKPNISPIAILNSKFAILKKLGSGSFGSVYLSYNIQEKSTPASLYAIKIITKEKSSFINPIEVDFLEKFNHKNILKVFEHGIGVLELPNGCSQQVYYIIMEHLNHGSLLNQINNNNGFNEGYARLIFLELLNGLESIHNSNIVHRDIKLENIMLSGNDYTLKYVDFGFATEKSNGLLNTFLGTPAYAAPELHLKKKYLGVYEDIFSLGITLFILVTGHLPFMLPMPNDVLYRYIFYGNYEAFWEKRKINVSQSFKELFINMVAFNPEQRPSISEIRNSKWMKEINLELKDEIKNEFIRREMINNEIHLKIQEQRKMMINKGNHNNKVRNVDEILNKIKEKKRIEFANDIKKHLFPMEKDMQNNVNNIIEDKSEKSENKIMKLKDIKDSDNLTGFIHVDGKIKINILINLLKVFLKKEGYSITKRDLINSNIEISNGELDVRLLFENMYKITKITFSFINGNKEDFINFKKIMKKLNLKEL